MQINIDGLPLFKSSNAQFWPILCLVKQPAVKDSVVVCLFSGQSKPAVNFLDEFVCETCWYCKSPEIVVSTCRE